MRRSFALYRVMGHRFVQGWLEPEVFEKMTWKSGGRALTHADNANIRAAQDGDLQMWQATLESYRCDESGAAAAKNDNLTDRVGR